MSSGRSQDDSYFLDNSADGDDVFFATAEGLEAGDTDGAYDVYDARVGGGFKKVDQAAPCAGDGCQGGVAGVPSVPVPGSAGFSGPQNQEPPDDRAKPAPSSKLKLGARRLVQRTLEVTVTIARPGRVTVSGGGLRGVSRAITTRPARPSSGWRSRRQRSGPSRARAGWAQRARGLHAEVRDGLVRQVRPQRQGVEAHGDRSLSMRAVINATLIALAMGATLAAAPAQAADIAITPGTFARR